MITKDGEDEDGDSEVGGRNLASQPSAESLAITPPGFCSARPRLLVSRCRNEEKHSLCLPTSPGPPGRYC